MAYQKCYLNRLKTQLSNLQKKIDKKEELIKPLKQEKEALIKYIKVYQDVYDAIHPIKNNETE